MCTYKNQHVQNNNRCCMCQQVHALSFDNHDPIYCACDISPREKPGKPYKSHTSSTKAQSSGSTTAGTQSSSVYFKRNGLDNNNSWYMPANSPSRSNSTRYHPTVQDEHAPECTLCACGHSSRLENNSNGSQKIVSNSQYKQSSPSIYSEDPTRYSSTHITLPSFNGKASKACCSCDTDDLGNYDAPKKKCPATHRIHMMDAEIMVCPIQEDKEVSVVDYAWMMSRACTIDGNANVENSYSIDSYEEVKRKERKKRKCWLFKKRR